MSRPFPDGYENVNTIIMFMTHLPLPVAEEHFLYTACTVIVSA